MCNDAAIAGVRESHFVTTRARVQREGLRDAAKDAGEPKATAIIRSLHGFWQVAKKLQRFVILRSEATKNLSFPWVDRRERPRGAYPAPAGAQDDSVSGFLPKSARASDFPRGMRRIERGRASR